MGVFIQSNQDVIEEEKVPRLDTLATHFLYGVLHDKHASISNKWLTGTNPAVLDLPDMQTLRARERESACVIVSVGMFVCESAVVSGCVFAFLPLTNTNTQIRKHTYTHTQTHTQTYKHTHANIHRHIHKHTHTDTNTHTQTHTHTHTQTHKNTHLLNGLDVELRLCHVLVCVIKDNVCGLCNRELWHGWLFADPKQKERKKKRRKEDGETTSCCLLPV